MIDDSTLMSEVCAGNTDRLGVLYERYKGPLFAYFFKLTRGHQQASEDLVQTVFHRVLKYKHQYKGTGNFVGWLFRIARNCGIDHHRNSYYYEDINQHQGILKDECHQPGQSEETNRIATLQQAIERLNPIDREVIQLGKIKELKYRDVAEILDCSESVVRVRIFRAVKRLREEYLKIEIAEK